METIKIIDFVNMQITDTKEIIKLEKEMGELEMLADSKKELKLLETAKYGLDTNQGITQYLKNVLIQYTKNKIFNFIK